MNYERIEPIGHPNADEKPLPRNARPFRTRQSIALLKILGIGQDQIANDLHVDGEAFFSELNELDQKRSLS